MLGKEKLGVLKGLRERVVLHDGMTFSFELGKLTVDPIAESRLPLDELKLVLKNHLKQEFKPEDEISLADFSGNLGAIRTRNGRVHSAYKRANGQIITNFDGDPDDMDVTCTLLSLN